MLNFSSYHRPSSLSKAIQLLSDVSDSKLIAGGTDLLINLKKKSEKQLLLVDICSLPELKTIRVDNEGEIKIGATATFSDIIRSSVLGKKVPFFCDAARSVAGPQIRNLATIGGNLCNGATSADSVPSLLVMNALLTAKGCHGERVIPIQKFHLDAGIVDLNPDEILLSITIPGKEYGGLSGCSYKYSYKSAMDVATLCCSVACRVWKHNISDIRIAFGGAGPRPVRCTHTEEKLLGHSVDADLKAIICNTIAADVTPRTTWRESKAFLLYLIPTIAYRCLQKAIKQQLQV